MPRSRSFTHSVLLGSVGQVLTISIGLWMGPFLIHHLGDLRYGLWLLGQQILVYLSLMDFGVIALLPRETAYVTGRPNSAVEMPRLVARTAWIVVMQTPVVAGIAAVLWFYLPHAWVEARGTAAVAAIAFSLLFPFRLFRALLEGMQDLAFTSGSYMSGWIAGLVVNVSLVAAGFGLKSLAFGWAANQATDAALCLWRLRSRFRGVLPRKWRHWWMGRRRAGVRQQLGRGAWVSVSQVAQVLIYGTDAAVIGNLFGPAAVVPYNCTGKLISVLANQPQNIMKAAEPGLSQMRVSEPHERLAAVTNALSLAMLLASGLVVTVSLAVNPSFVRWWIGPNYYAGALLTVLFAASMMLRHLNVTAIYTLFAFGHERLLAMTNLADGIFSTLFSVLFAWALHSPVGVVLGSILSTCCVLVFGNGPRLARELNISLGQLALPLTGWFWRMLLAGAGAWMLGVNAGRAGVRQILIDGALAASAYALLMIPVASKSALRPYLLPKFEALRARVVPRSVPSAAPHAVPNAEET